MISDRAGLEALIRRVGILPFFPTGVPGWSLAENIDPAVWFTGADGPWEWKGRQAKAKRYVYGRLVDGKNAWVSLDCYPDLANLRRDGYDFEGRCEDGLVPWREKQLMAWIEAHAPVLSKSARRLSGVTKGFDTALTHLQMQTFILNQDFVYDIDRRGRAYGWGNALLSTPERWFGEDFLAAGYARKPEESFALLMDRLRSAMPWAEEAQLARALRG